MHRKKTGFTLIELLVVIAIIAILAAILFPVFAQAREKARATACLSNIKQLDTGLLMYTEDYDERYPASWAKGFPGDPMFFVQPYLKSLDVLVCPDFRISVASADAVCGPNANDPYGTWYLLPGERDNPTGEPYLWGYGFNVGPSWFSQFSGSFDGLMSDPQTPDLYSGYDGNTSVAMNILGHTIQVTPRKYARPGAALAEVAAPATCLLNGDTTEPPLSSIQLQALHITQPSDSPCEKLLNANNARHTGGYNFSFVDGHAKYQKYTGQPTNYGDFGSVANLCMYFKSYDGGSNPGKCQTNGF